MRLRRLPVLGASAALLAAVSVVPGTARATSPSPVAAVAGLTALADHNSVDLGPAGAAPARVVLGLALRNPGELAALLRSQYTPGSPAYHRFLTPAQFAARFGPAQASVDEVTSWTARAGLTVTSVSPNRTLVTAEGPAAAIGAAFAAPMHLFRSLAGAVYAAPVSDARLPAALAGKVDDVIGLNGASRALAAPRRAAQLGFPQSYGPHELWAAYNAPGGQVGQGRTIAVLAAGDVSRAKSDLVIFEDRFGLPHVPWSTIATGPPSSDRSGADEWDLDTQYSTAMAPGAARLLVYDAPSSNDPDAVIEINRWVTDNLSLEASASWGECESQAQASGLLAGGDKALMQAVAEGKTLFTASGDSGGFCGLGLPNGVPLGGPGDNYPASSPFAVAVGGTTLLSGIPRPAGEIAWVAGGGGISTIEPVPFYQQHAGGSFLPIRRGVPDVALDADTATGYTVIVAGQPVTIGGTSAGAPAWLGIWARAQSAHGGGLGFANPTIYREPASSFYDVVLGTDVPWVATPGWDYATGRGTANIAGFIATAG